MSPAKLSTKLQEDFVRTELETGHRMLALAIQQRSAYEYEAAAQSLSLARVALTGAQQHLDTVKLPQGEIEDILEDVRRLRSEVETFERATRTVKKVHSDA